MPIKILDNFTTSEILGNGMFGTVSKIELDGKQYALKIEKIRNVALEIQNVMSDEFSEWREIIFLQILEIFTAINLSH